MCIYTMLQIASVVVSVVILIVLMVVPVWLLFKQKGTSGRHRQQRHGAAAAQDSGSSSSSENEANDGEDRDGGDDVEKVATRTRTQLLRAQKRAGKQAARRQDELDKAERDQTKNERTARYLQQLEERRLAKQQNKEHSGPLNSGMDMISGSANLSEEEYQRWASQMQLMQTPDEQNMNDDGSRLYTVDNFISYIKERKIVNLEEMSEEFQMDVSDIVKRIREFEAEPYRLLYGTVYKSICN